MSAEHISEKTRDELRRRIQRRKAESVSFLRDLKKKRKSAAPEEMSE